MLAAIVFVSCNIDSLLLLMTLLCTPAFPLKSVLIGQFLSQSILILLSVALARLALHVAPTYIGLAGLLPITLGARKLFDRHSSPNEKPLDQPGRATANTSNHAVGMTTVLSLSNGADNLSAYIPIFTVRPPSAILSMSIIFLVMAMVFCLIAWLLAHRLTGLRIRRYSQALMPWNMIALGVYVLSGSAGHLLPLQSA